MTMEGFYCILNLPYSQTANIQVQTPGPVLLYSEFTLLSNAPSSLQPHQSVLLYSEFTLLSNKRRCSGCWYTVLLYSEFTLLSNPCRRYLTYTAVLLYSEFTLLSNNSFRRSPALIVLLYSEFTLLSNLTVGAFLRLQSFTVFWIYTTLKPVCDSGINPHWFYCILNLHYSQTPSLIFLASIGFYCILNLHYSQTCLLS